MRADDALARILAGVPPLPSVDVAILDALGLVLDEEVVADRDVPPFRNSAMDGYAVRARDVADAPASLRVIGEIAAGRSPTRTVGPGEAMRIMTGAPVPEGAEPWVRGIVRDSPDALRAALREASAADAIVTSGGVSVGDHDYMKPIMSELGTIDFWAIAIRPGRPLAFGELRDGDRRVPVFGLPGNVVSSLVTFELFVRPALLRMQGRDEVARPRTKARLLEPIEKIASLRVFARGIHDPSAGTVRTTGPQGSGILRSLSLANCLIDLPEGRARHEAGEQVDVILTEQPEPR